MRVFCCVKFFLNECYFRILFQSAVYKKITSLTASFEPCNQVLFLKENPFFSHQSNISICHPCLICARSLHGYFHKFLVYEKFCVIVKTEGICWYFVGRWCTTITAICEVYITALLKCWVWDLITWRLPTRFFW